MGKQLRTIFDNSILRFDVCVTWPLEKGIKIWNKGRRASGVGAEFQTQPNNEMHNRLRARQHDVNESK